MKLSSNRVAVPEPLATKTEDHAPATDDAPRRDIDWEAIEASPEFQEVGAWLRARLDERAAGLPEPEREALEAVFLTSSRYEYMFWDMAWRREGWPA